MKLKSPEQEAKACLKAFEGFKLGGVVVHCHHEELVEKLSEPAKNRINYILKEKPKNEQALRLRLFRPVTGSALAEYEKVEWTAHKLICKAKDCPWNGKTIFP